MENWYTAHSTHRHGQCTLNVKTQIRGSKIKIENVTVSQCLSEELMQYRTQKDISERKNNERVKETLPNETAMTEQKVVQILSIGHLIISFQNA